MMAFSWILFDADHTLFDFDRSANASLKLTLEEFGHPYEEHFYPIYYQINKRVWRAFEEGKISRDTLRTKRFSAFFDALGISLPAAEFNAAYLSKLPGLPYFMQDAVQVLETLQGDYRLGVITNGLQEVQRPRLVQCGAIRYFDLVVISGEIGHAKPHRAYFDYAHQNMGRPEKDRVLVVGDNLYSDIKGGFDFGYKTCWFNPNGQKNEEGVTPHFEIARLSDLFQLLD